MRCVASDCPLQVYWCGPLLGGIAAALLYENVFAVNASLSKAKGFLLAADYDPEDYEPNKEQPAEVTLLNILRTNFFFFGQKGNHASMPLWVVTFLSLPLLKHLLTCSNNDHYNLPFLWVVS